MDVKSGVGSYGSYRPLNPPPKQQFGGNEAKAEADEVPRTVARRVPQTDRIASLAHSYDKKEHSMSPESLAKKRRTLAICNKVSWGGSIASFIVFVIVFTQPIVAPLLTFGCCFTSGMQDWLEFSIMALSMSIIPGFVAAFLAACGLASDYGLKVLNRRIENHEGEDPELAAVLEVMNHK